MSNENMETTEIVETVNEKTYGAADMLVITAAAIIVAERVFTLVGAAKDWIVNRKTKEVEPKSED